MYILFLVQIISIQFVLSQSFVQKAIYFDAPFSNFATGDFDNDGDQDIFGISSFFQSPSDFYFFKNEGSLNFIIKNKIKDIDSNCRPASGDFDKDGDIDIIISKGANKTLTLLENDGAGNFTEKSLNIDGPFVIELYDLENDGDLDIIGNYLSKYTVDVFINNGNLNFTKKNIIKDNFDLEFSKASDLDKDGDIDVIVGLNSFSGEQILVYYNDGNNTFSKTVVAKDNSELVTAIDVVDLDKDGNLDIISTNKYDGINAYLKKGNVFELKNLISYSGSGSGYVSIVASDFDNDGNIDLMTGDGGQGPMKWFKNLGTASLEFEKLDVSGISPAYSMKSLDFDGDGDKDVLTVNGDLWLLENNIPQVNSNAEVLNTAGVKILPNPSSDYLTIPLEENSIKNFIIVDVNGQIVSRSFSGNNKIDISKLVSGVYNLIIKEGSNGKIIFSDKFTKI